MRSKLGLDRQVARVYDPIAKIEGSVIYLEVKGKVRKSDNKSGDGYRENER